jgi:catechol 2,3-dioxygenase-like lactoylglutathione lyase family enzyme
MISAVDHFLLGGSASTYEALLGRRMDAHRLQMTNVGLVFRPGSAALSRIVFATPSLEKAKRLLERRGVATTGDDVLHLASEATHGVPIAIVQRPAPPPPSPAATDEASAITGLDHVVIRSPNPERAIAFYAGRLGLDLRLDRSNPAWGSRLLFFRCGDLVVEIAHDLAKGVSGGPDQLWGLSWRAADIGRVHARLKASGVDVSDIREGRRGGSQVFTVKSHTEGVPTIVIGGIGRR